MKLQYIGLTHKNVPCEQRGAASQRLSSAQRKVDRNTWAKFSGVSSCHIVKETWPGPAEGTPLSPPHPEGGNMRADDKKMIKTKMTTNSIIISNKR